jgi:Tol biopolymer transport system component
MRWSKRNKRLAVVLAAVIAVGTEVALGVADSAVPPEAGPAVRTHLDHSNIYVVDVQSRQLTQPTHHPEAREPSWSSDGHIVFSGMDCDECLSALSEVDASGSNQVRVQTSVKHVFQPSWAPDGRRLAAVGLGRGIYEVDTTSNTAKRLTSGPSDEAPAWAPSGDRIAFHRQVRGTNYDLFEVNAATGRERRITNDPQQQTNPSWSPDGARIAFAQQQGNGKWAIFTISADGSGRKRVTPGAMSAQEPSWSPDGTKIAFILQGLDRATLATIDAGGGGTPERLTDGSLFPSKPTWSPDGKTIAFGATVVQ